MKNNLITDLLLSLSFSFFGLLLIFGLGFVFPTIDPYASIKWIIIVSAVVFFYSFISFILVKVMEIRAWRKEAKKSVKSKKTSRK